MPRQNLHRLLERTALRQLQAHQLMVAAVEKELEARTMGISLSPEERFEVFGEHDPAQYDAEVEERWGETDAYKESQRRAKSYTKEQWVRIKAEGDAVMERFAQAKRDGAEPGSEQADAAVQAHRDHIETWFNDVPLPMLRGTCPRRMIELRLSKLPGSAVTTPPPNLASRPPPATPPASVFVTGPRA